MNRTALVLSLGFGALVLSAQHAFPDGRSRCAPRDVALKQLAERWKETRRSIMLAGADGLFEVFAADHSGTWTILRTTPDGLSCVIASGVAFESRPRPTGSPA